LGFLEYLEILVVREDFDVMGGSFEVMTPLLESFNDSKKFSVIDIIIAFSFNKGFRHERYRVPETIIPFLGQHHPTSLF